MTSAAHSIIHKSSDVPGDRPSIQDLSPKEIGLNVDSQEPGLFFRTNDGKVIKTGPTTVGPKEPSNLPSKGETWLNTVRGTLGVGTWDIDGEKWAEIVAPLCGGSSRVVFLAPEFNFASDKLGNNGQSLPFRTINRAILELAKMLIQDISLKGSEKVKAQKYTILYAPSALVANNSKGDSLLGFNRAFGEDPDYEPSLEELVSFNHPDGGIIFPGNISLVGMDLQKCVIHPSYIPNYKKPFLPPEYAGLSEPLSSVFRVSPGSYFENIQIWDKIDRFMVTRVTRSLGGLATFHTNGPHGLVSEEIVHFSLPTESNSDLVTFRGGSYVVNPLDSNSFRLYVEDSSVLREERTFVRYDQVVRDGVSQELGILGSLRLSSAHRLRVFKEVSYRGLSDYLTKVQRAFKGYFGGKIIPGEELVQTLLKSYTGLHTNENHTTIDLFNKIVINSLYGMCGGEVDGNNVGDDFSLYVQDSSISSTQQDPGVWEIYTTLTNKKGKTEQGWFPLIEAAYQSLLPEERPTYLHETPIEAQINLLETAPTSHLRCHYGLSGDKNGQNFGFADPESDCRSFGIKVINSGHIYCDNVSTNAVIGKWALNGGSIIDSDSETRFGISALRSEGFRGRGTIGGSYSNLKGFRFNGIFTPLSLTNQQVEDRENKEILTLGGRVVDIDIDPSNPDIQLVILSCNFLPSFIMPYSLAPNSAVWVNSGSCSYRGFFATDGGPTIKTVQEGPFSGKTALRVRLSDSTIPTNKEIISGLDIPYIRRFRDPRSGVDSSYRIVLGNSNPDSIPPSPGNVLRIDQTSPGLSNPKIKPGFQLDPGPNGGWGQVFSVNHVNTLSSSLSPNYNYSLIDEEQDTAYLVTTSVSDMSFPWFPGVKMSSGGLVTFGSRNWYAAENSTGATYYDFPESEGVDVKATPEDSYSPFIPSAHFESQTLRSETYLGVSYNPYGELEGSYLRGYTLPPTEYPVKNYFDQDDGSEGLGIILKNTKTGFTTNLVSDINEDSYYQSEVKLGEGPRYRPAIVEFSVLSPQHLTNPRQNISIVEMEKEGITEFFQIISLVGTRVAAIRLNRDNSFFEAPSGKELPTWESGQIVHICDFHNYPHPEAYDPDWSNSKSSVYRLFEVMGYSRALMKSTLKPRYWGERHISLDLLPQKPDIEGYAIETGSWYMEFNEPSVITSTSHYWDSCGYISPSRGLKQNRTNIIPRKMSYDCMAYSSWGGRILVEGVNEKGDPISIGPSREALTSRHQDYGSSPKTSLVNQQLYEEQPYTEFPSQVIAYSTDDISKDFSSNRLTFPLTKGGFPVPLSQLKTESLFVQVGAIVQRPGLDYAVNGDNIRFARAPEAGLNCDIRVVTSEDGEKTLKVIPFRMREELTGDRSIFSLDTDEDISPLEIDYDNLLVFLGGVLQTPEYSYFLTRDSATQLTISFSEVLPKGTTPDIRAVCTSSLWALRGIQPVALYSLDSLFNEFNGNETRFQLRYQNKLVNPSIVNQENTIVSIGGASQIPGFSYEVKKGEIIFSEPPLLGSTSEIRVITNAPYIPCLDKRGRKESFLYWGPSIVLDLENAIARLENG